MSENCMVQGCPVTGAELLDVVSLLPNGMHVRGKVCDHHREGVKASSLTPQLLASRDPWQCTIFFSSDGAKHLGVHTYTARDVKGGWIATCAQAAQTLQRVRGVRKPNEHVVAVYIQRSSAEPPAWPVSLSLQVRISRALAAFRGQI